MKRPPKPPFPPEEPSLDRYLKHIIYSAIDEALRPRLVHVFDLHSKAYELRTGLISYCWVEDRIIRFAVPSITSTKFHVFMSLSDMEDKLPPLDFIRVNQNFIINIHDVKAVEWSEHLIVMNDGYHVEYTRTYAEMVEARLSEFARSLRSVNA